MKGVPAVSQPIRDALGKVLVELTNLAPTIDSMSDEELREKIGPSLKKFVQALYDSAPSPAAKARLRQTVVDAFAERTEHGFRWPLDLSAAVMKNGRPNRDIFSSIDMSEEIARRKRRDAK